MATSSRLPVMVPLLAALAAALHVLPPAVTAALQFDRAAIGAGELWRLVTGHFTHFDASHLGWDVAVFLALGGACECRSRRVTALTLLAAAGAISAGVWAWQPQFATYRGLSGLDCALFALHAGALMRQPEPRARAVGGLALLALGAKCVAELALGRTVFAAGAGYAPVPLAHLLGGLAGLAGAALLHRTAPAGAATRGRERVAPPVHA